jgi:hypothetical protein
VPNKCLIVCVCRSVPGANNAHACEPTGGHNPAQDDSRRGIPTAEARARTQTQPPRLASVTHTRHGWDHQRWCGCWCGQSLAVTIRSIAADTSVLPRTQQPPTVPLTLTLTVAVTIPSTVTVCCSHTNNATHSRVNKHTTHTTHTILTPTPASPDTHTGRGPIRADAHTHDTHLDLQSAARVGAESAGEDAHPLAAPQARVQAAGPHLVHAAVHRSHQSIPGASATASQPADKHTHQHARKCGRECEQTGVLGEGQ